MSDDRKPVYARALDARVSGWPELRQSLTVQAGQASGTVIRCGLIDTILADLPISVVFCYRGAPDDDRLARGLATALAQIPAFGGRLRTTGDQLEISCDDSGVSLTSYDIDETLAEAIARVTMPGAGYVDHVDAPKARLGGLPLFTARVNRLSDGGMVLGCSWHHSVGDLTTFMLLMRAWSAAVEDVPPPDLVLVEDPEAYLDEVLPAEDSGLAHFRLMDEHDTAELTREVNSALRLNRTVQVYFGDAELSRMREAFCAEAGRRLSVNDSICAHVVSALRELNDDGESRMLALPVNVRPRLDLPAGAVGNLVNEIFMNCPGGISAAQLAVEIRIAVETFMQAHLAIRANRVFLERVGRERFADCVPIGFDPVARTMTITNWTHSSMYDIPFGGFQPVFASPMANLQLPWIAWLLEGFDKTGLILTIGVPARLAAKMRSVEGSALLHRFRTDADQLPELAGTVRKLI